MEWAHLSVFRGSSGVGSAALEIWLRGLGYCIVWAALIHSCILGVGSDGIDCVGLKRLAHQGSAHLGRVQWLGLCGFHGWGRTRWTN